MMDGWIDGKPESDPSYDAAAAHVQVVSMGSEGSSRSNQQK
jgi:hypothetical protein